MDTITEKPFTVRRWTKVTFWGWLLGVVFILMISSFLDSIGIEGMQFYLGVGMGAGVGLTQWLSLKKYIEINTNWIWFSVFGMGIPFIIIDYIPSEVIPHKLPFSIPLGAITAGFLQYLLLKKHSAKANLWIAGSFVGWSLGVTTVFIIDYTNYIKSLIPFNLVIALINLLLILAGGIILGVITGKTLKKILG